MKPNPVFMTMPATCVAGIVGYGTDVVWGFTQTGAATVPA